jgi:hypothetical protein
MVKVPIKGTKPSMSLEYRSSRRHIESIEIEFGRDPRYLAKAAEVTGFPASEVGASTPLLLC